MQPLHFFTLILLSASLALGAGEPASSPGSVPRKAGVCSAMLGAVAKGLRALAGMLEPQPGEAPVAPTSTVSGSNSASPRLSVVELGELLTVYPFLLMEGADVIDPVVKKRILKLLRLPETADLTSPQTLLQIRFILRSQLSPEAMEMQLGHMILPLTHLANDLVADRNQQLLERKGPDVDGITKAGDEFDLARDWGFRLLPDNDPAFQDPVFLARLLQAREQSAIFQDRFPPLALLVQQEFDEAFKRQAGRFAHSVESFHLTGSDANEAAAVKYGPFAVFTPCWGTSRGKVLREYQKKFEVKAPVSHEWGDGPGPFVLSVEEKAAIDRVVTLAADKKIRGIFLEPIVGAHGVMFYRPGFMKELAEVARSRGLIIVVDEVLTGGGRTGKFYAFEHYEGFIPDVITFGKGLQVSGVASMPGLRRVAAMRTTITNYIEPMLKSTQILRAIHERSLVENAAAMGDYFLSSLQAAAQTIRPELIRGKGLLLSSTWWHLAAYRHDNRVMPPLTITREQIDFIMQAKKSRTIPLRSRAYERNRQERLSAEYRAAHPGAEAQQIEEANGEVQDRSQLTLQHDPDAELNDDSTLRPAPQNIP